MYVCMYVCMRFGSLGLQSSSALAFLRDLLRPISWKDLGCSAQDHVVEKGKPWLRRRRRSWEQGDEVGKRELCLLEEEEEEEEQLTEVQHSSVCLLERSTQQQQRGT